MTEWKERCIHGIGPCPTCWDKLEISYWQSKAILLNHRLEMISEGCYRDIKEAREAASRTLARVGKLKQEEEVNVDS